jgi:hypothetical protein
MGTIVISENVSLDGVIEDPAGVEGFRRGGWFFETDRGEDGEKFTLDKTLGTEALLLGRRSYEFFAATWPSRGGELADKLNSLPKYVVSSTLEDPDYTELAQQRYMGRRTAEPRQPIRPHSLSTSPRVASNAVLRSAAGASGSPIAATLSASPPERVADP